ncbi:MAG TPA: serine hydrolase [Thermoanaerobaculia bacterium]|jgi:CubicO group peptidase (beta-lactamase class C family)
MSRRRLLSSLVLFAVLLPLGCSTYVRRLVTLRTIDVEDYRSLPSRSIAASSQPSPLPSAPDRGWITRMPLEVQNGRLTTEAELDAFLSSRGTTAFLVVRDGRLIDERYYHGYARESWFKSFSISKSVLSALVGIARSEGVIRMSDPLGMHVDLKDNPALAAVTLEQLADNVSGFRYRRGNAPWKEQPRMYYTADVRAFLARTKLIRTPGTKFEAEELSPLLLGYALERALLRKYPGMTLSRYAEERLWQPMGAAYGALWNVDRETNGLEKTESGFVARAVDLARFGLLYLHGGKAAARQVVPSEWVSATVTPPPANAPNLFGDGFHRKLWWGVVKPGGAQSDFYSNGHFGQRIYVSPRKRLVLVRMGRDSAGVNWTALLGRIADAWPED